jgi:hypothetical protein
MTELQDINHIIRWEFDNYKITGNARHYVEELSKLSDITAEEHVTLVFQFLCAATYWETKLGIATKERLLNLAKKKLKIPIYPKYKIR